MKVQKLSLDAGFSCPNRDGTKSWGGCIYCDNRSFTPKYCDPADGVSEQLRKGKEFFRRKYPEMKYLAYFQSFTGTHSDSSGLLERLYEEAISDKDIVGVIIGTRPDSLPDNVVNLLGKLNEKTRVIVEIGAETSHDSTLRRVNRCHTWKDVADSTIRLWEKGIEVGLHLIAGLPEEDEDMIIETMRRACLLPVKSLKIHQLQIIRGTPLERLAASGEMKMLQFSIEDYIDLCVRIIGIVNEMSNRSIAIERFVATADKEMVVAPRWGIKNFEFTNLVINKLKTIK